MFAAAFDDALNELPNAWRTATFDVRVEAPLLPAGSHDLSAEEAARSVGGLRDAPPDAQPCRAEHVARNRDE